MQFTTTPPAPTNGAPTVLPKAEAQKRDSRQLLIGAIFVVLLAVVAFILFRTLSRAPITLVTTSVQQGTLVRTVTSSGTVNPQDTISIGSQISGTISEIDVDYNSVVKIRQVLARIDPTLFQAALAQAQSQLTQTEANARVAASSSVGANAGVTVQRDTATAAAENISVARANAAAQADAIATAQSNVDKTQSALVLRTVDHDE